MLHASILNNDFVQLLADLKLSYINVNERDKLLQTPLHAVCTLGNKEVVEALLQRSADVNAVDLNNWAPIHCAASNCHLAIVQLLIDHPRIKINLISKDGTSAFHYLMRIKVAPEEEEYYLRILEQARAKGADINLHSGKSLETPLHQATLRSNTAAVRFLLKYGVNVNAQNKIGETALHYAVRNRDPDCIALLRGAKADMSISSTEGTVFDIANAETKPFLTGSAESLQIEKSRGGISVSNAGVCPPTPPSDPQGNMDQYIQYQQQLQQYMLLQYRAQACQNGTPTALPIFCSTCARPFTYPPGAISIKCPMCKTVNPITETQPQPTTQFDPAINNFNFAQA